MENIEENVFGDWLEDTLRLKLLSRAQIIGRFKREKFRTEDSKRDMIELFNSYLNDNIFTGKAGDSVPYFMNKKGNIERCGLQSLKNGFRGMEHKGPYPQKITPVKCLVETDVEPLNIKVMEFYGLRGGKTGEYAYSNYDTLIVCKGVCSLLERHLK